MLDADRGVSFEEGHGKVIEKTLSVQSDLDLRGVLGIVPFGGVYYINYLPLKSIGLKV